MTRTLLLTLTASLGLFAQAPTEDRVGFPANYTQTFTRMLTVDRADNGQIRVIWGNDVASRTPPWENYPRGAVLLFESWTSKRNADNTFARDENGRLIPDALTTLFVKRKGEGFGEAYGPLRNGEWEYAAYRPDGTVQTAPRNTAACARCHILAGPRDYTFRRDRMFAQGSGASPTATISQYQFVPGDLSVRKGAVVHWLNDDEVEHQIYSPSLFHSAPMVLGSTHSQRFDTPGEFEIRCTIHPGMRAKVIVKE